MANWLPNPARVTTDLEGNHTEEKVGFLVKLLDIQL